MKTLDMKMLAITTNALRTTTLAAALGLLAGGAMAQTAVPPAASLGYSASPLNGQGYATRDAVQLRGPLTVMGMTGGIEPKDPVSTGSVVRRPAAPWQTR